MQAIVFQDGVYVYIDTNKDLSDNISKLTEGTKNKIYFFVSANQNVYLFGGRVRIAKLNEYNRLYIEIDGISIEHFYYEYSNPYRRYAYHFVNNWSYEQITTILNQIEQLGVDIVLSHYKDSLNESVNALKDELKFLEQKNETSPDNMSTIEKNKLIDYPTTIQHIVNILSILLIMFFPCGLTNMQYINAFENAMNTYFA